MSYQTIALIAQDADLRQRLIACAAEQAKDANPGHWVDQRLWRLAATPGWGASWASALLANIARPGWDESVITDAAILAAVQPMN